MLLKHHMKFTAAEITELVKITKQVSRAAKLSLLNFLSLFRDLQKPTRFGGGGVVTELFPCSPDADATLAGGGVVAEFFRDLQLRHPILPHIQ